MLEIIIPAGAALVNLLVVIAGYKRLTVANAKTEGALAESNKQFQDATRAEIKEIKDITQRLFDALHPDPKDHFAALMTVGNCTTIHSHCWEEIGKIENRMIRRADDNKEEIKKLRG